MPRERINYQSGFGNTFSTEALKGALPVGRNSPQRAPKDLYAEVLSGTAFTAPRADNQSSWDLVAERVAGGFAAGARVLMRS